MADETYTVERILDARQETTGDVSYLIRWKDFGPDEDSWEPLSNLNCTTLIAAFEAKRRGSTRTTNPSPDKPTGRVQSPYGSQEEKGSEMDMDGEESESNDDTGNEGTNAGGGDEDDVDSGDHGSDDSSSENQDAYYEEQRRANIARNQQFLKQLSIDFTRDQEPKQPRKRSKYKKKVWVKKNYNFREGINNPLREKASNEDQRPRLHVPLPLWVV